LEKQPDEVRWELLEATYQTLPPVALAFPLIGCLAVHLLGPELGILPSYWLASLVIAASLSLLACRLFRLARRQNYPLWSGLRMISAAWNGLTFGLAGVFLMVPGRPDLQVYLFVLLAGTAATAVTSSSSHFPSLAIYLSTSLLPLIGHAGNESEAGLAGIARLVPIFWGVILGVGLRTHKIQRQSAQLGFENRSLVADLKMAQKELEQTNRGLNQEVAQRSLALSRFRALLDASSEGILVASAEGGQVLDCNQAARALLDISPERSLLLEQLPRLGGVCWPQEPLEGLKFHHQATVDDPIEISGVYRSFANKLYLVLVLRDARWHLELEQQLRAAQKVELVGQMAGGIAHDFNNMLTVIMGLTEYLRDSFEADDPRHQDAQDILHTSERARELTKKLLRLSRSKLDQPEPIEINERLREISTMLRRSLAGGIELVVLPSESPQVVRMNPGDLDQLLLNLAVNASDAMGERGIFTVEIGPAGPLPVGLNPGNYTGLTVRDTGIGMSPEVARQVFEPFFTTKGPRGHGLGLAVSHSIVVRAGGAIQVESQPGEGTTFRIWLPLDPQSPGAAPETAQTPALEPQNAWVLLVEDQDQLRNMMQRTLTNLGYRVIATRSSEEALVRCHEQPFELLLSDIVLPGISGVELARKLRDQVPHILMMSGFADEAPNLDGLPLPLLTKPFTQRQLLDCLKDVLGTSPASA